MNNNFISASDKIFTKKIICDDLFNRNEYFFNSSVLDMKPYLIYKNDNQYIIEIKTLGITSDDISVTFDKLSSILTIKGETPNKYNKKSFSMKLSLKIDEDILDLISNKGIEYQTENGITYVFLNLIDYSNPDIKISKKND